MPPPLSRLREAARAASASLRARRARGARDPDADLDADDGVVRREGPIRHAWRRFRRGTDRYRLLTDVVGGLLLVAFVVGGLAAATGGVWPPIVVIESGSMMHAIQDTDYGRIGTIDVGDIIFIRAVRGPEDLTTWAQGGEEHYGRPGDVIAFAPNGDHNTTPIIHRVVAYISVGTDDRGRPTYGLHWIDDRVLVFDSAGIYFPPLGFDETWGYTPQRGYRPAYSGYITKGDNAFSNPVTDQALNVNGVPISPIVEPAWIIGKAYGELPWMGLAKLALQSGQTNPETPGWERFGNAFAPLELWTMFFLTVTLVLLVPLSVDTWRAWRHLKDEQALERRLEEENRRRIAERKAAAAAAAQQAPRRVTTFAAVVSSRPAPRTRPGERG